MNLLAPMFARVCRIPYRSWLCSFLSWSLCSRKTCIHKRSLRGSPSLMLVTICSSYSAVYQFSQRNHIYSKLHHPRMSGTGSKRVWAMSRTESLSAVNGRLAECAERALHAKRSASPLNIEHFSDHEYREQSYNAPDDSKQLNSTTPCLATF